MNRYSGVHMWTVTVVYTCGPLQWCAHDVDRYSGVHMMWTVTGAKGYGSLYFADINYICVHVHCCMLIPVYDKHLMCFLIRTKLISTLLVSLCGHLPPFTYPYEMPPSRSPMRCPPLHTSMRCPLHVPL